MKLDIIANLVSVEKFIIIESCSLDPKIKNNCVKKIYKNVVYLMRQAIQNFITKDYLPGPL